MRLASLVGLFGLCFGLVACDGSAAGSCSSAEDVAAKVTALSDDLKKAQDSGKLDIVQAGDVGAQMLSAGAKYGAEKDHRAYCRALDGIRKSAGL
jgi:hypothetical protein